MTAMLRAECHCGRVSIGLANAPVEVTECNCSICRRYGVLWAYYPRADVVVSASEDATSRYAWDDRSIDFVRCSHCGCVTHWSPNDGRDRMGINARLLPMEILAAAKVRHLDGAVTERYID